LRLNMAKPSKYELLLRDFCERLCNWEAVEVIEEVQEDNGAVLTVRVHVSNASVERNEGFTSYRTRLRQYFEWSHAVNSGTRSSEVARTAGISTQAMHAFLHSGGPPYPQNCSKGNPPCSRCSQKSARLGLCPTHYAEAAGIKTSNF
jgi:hypothetical protein